jgi:hypothetical protein
MLGTSDTWSMSCLSDQPSDPAYYIEDCRISYLSWAVGKVDTRYAMPYEILPKTFEKLLWQRWYDTSA